MRLLALSETAPDKTENEDRIVLGDRVLSSGAATAELTDGIVAVADGVGGHRGGAIAAQCVAERIAGRVALSVDDLREINGELLALARAHPECAGLATTLSALTVRNGSAEILSTGNTRVWLVRAGGYLKQLTEDDTTLCELLRSGRLSPEEAERFPRKNEITACLGGGDPRLFRVRSTAVGELISPVLITSDGIHDHLSVDRMEELLASEGLTASLCTALIAAARANGSRDDASVVLCVP